MRLGSISEHEEGMIDIPSPVRAVLFPGSVVLGMCLNLSDLSSIHASDKTQPVLESTVGQIELQSVRVSQVHCQVLIPYRLPVQ